jgi:hypothetical protein
MTRRYALLATLVVAVNLLLTIWHLYVLGQINPTMTRGQLIVAGCIVSLVPLTSGVLSWTPRHRLAGWLMVASLGLGFAVGSYVHFLSGGSDTVFAIAAGEWTLPFRVSASLLVVVEALGCWVGLRLIFGRRSSGNFIAADRRRA